MAKIQSARVSDVNSIRVSTYFLKLFALFDFFVTGDKYMTSKLGPNLQKKLKKYSLSIRDGNRIAS